MEEHTEAPQSDEAQYEPTFRIGTSISRVVVTIPETRGNWLHNVTVMAFVNEQHVGLCRARMV